MKSVVLKMLRTFDFITLLLSTNGQFLRIAISNNNNNNNAKINDRVL